MPTVSVIIPLYKSEAYIEGALDSVLSQTYTDFEVICVDDCSPDGTAAIVKEYAKKDSRIRYIAHPKNMGAPAFGRNTGLQEARGDYVTFLDHDDTFLPTKLADLLGVMEREKVDFICSNCVLINSETGLADMHAWGEVSGDVKAGFAKRLLQDNFVPPNSTLIRRSVFEVVKGFDTSLRGVDDFDLWYRISRQFPSTVLNKPLCTWRYLNTGSISSDQQLMLKDEIAFYQKIAGLVDATDEERVTAIDRTARDKMRLANRQLLAKDYSAAIKNYREADKPLLATVTATVPNLLRFAYSRRMKNHASFTPLHLIFS